MTVRARQPVLIPLFLVALALGGCGRASVAPVRGDPPPAWLVEMARGEAQANEDPNPTSAAYALSDTKEIAPLVGVRAQDIPPATSVYVVMMTGDFVARYARIPSDAKIPTGDTIVFSVDPTTRVANDFSIGDGIDVSGTDGHLELIPFSL